MAVRTRFHKADSPLWVRVTSVRVRMTQRQDALTMGHGH